MGRDQLLDQNCFVDKETTLCSWDLWELYYSFSLHSLVIFSVFFRIIYKPWVERSKKEEDLYTITFGQVSENSSSLGKTSKVSISWYL